MPPRRSGNSSASMLSSSPSEASSSPASARPRHTLDRDDKTLRDMVLGYLFEPAFAFNYIVVLSWVPVRLFLLKELGSLPQADWLGLTRVRTSRPNQGICFQISNILCDMLSQCYIVQFYIQTH